MCVNKKCQNSLLLFSSSGLSLAFYLSCIFLQNFPTLFCYFPSVPVYIFPSIFFFISASFSFLFLVLQFSLFFPCFSGSSPVLYFSIIMITTTLSIDAYYFYWSCEAINISINLCCPYRRMVPVPDCLAKVCDET